MCYRLTHLFICTHYQTVDVDCGKKCPRVGGIHLPHHWDPQNKACGALRNCRLSSIERVLNGGVIFATWTVNVDSGPIAAKSKPNKRDDDFEVEEIEEEASTEVVLRTPDDRHRAEIEYRRAQEGLQAKVKEIKLLEASPPTSSVPADQSAGATPMVPYQGQYQHSAGQLIGFDPSQYPSHHHDLRYQHPSQLQVQHYQTQLSGYATQYSSQVQQQHYANPYPHQHTEQYPNLLPASSDGYHGSWDPRAELYDRPGVAGLLPPPEAPDRTDGKGKPEKGEKGDQNNLRREHKDQREHGRRGGKEKKQKRYK
ncbi:hypothetical protein B0T20DRAFT_395728 [Sordaria brevicollis]|uniref:Uncharacterized protein n=1 Tax=Sordaria brevicollis TaxID=83679 RepID=A0AAE0U9L0_SORBR|nr:hypothetical protein B0T20DRAFT_395728 [Sordaria brevicollis]